MSDPTPCPGLSDLVGRLDAAVRLGDPIAVTARIKAELEACLGQAMLRLPDTFRRVRPDTYARRLLHRDPATGYTAVVMTWGPGQRTPLHDHAGIWCVEGVVEGEMGVTQYDLIAENEGTYRFSEQVSMRAGIGRAGCLIPPYEYHVLENLDDRPSITLHVYGGEMDHCHVFEPCGGGAYRRVARTLAYHE
jgi:predicted metal-dependent enzyme (double-stranded beta helix superfamily)